MRVPLTAPQLCEWKLSDGYVARGRYWPASRPAAPAAILYLHGIQSHGGWYERSASLLAAAGCAVLMPDRRGSGLNDAQRGDAPSAAVLLDDLDRLEEALRSACGASQIAMAGVSWGGKLAVAWALRRPQRVSHLLLIAPGIFPRVDVGLARRLGIAAALLTSPARRFEIPLNDPALFTDNPAGRAFIAADPRRLTHATARLLFASARLDAITRNAKRGALRARTTLVLAGRDRIIRNEPTRAWLRHVAAQPPQELLLQNAAHTLEFEPDFEPFESLLRRWAAQISGQLAPDYLAPGRD